jgi:hypothetical protein
MQRIGSSLSNASTANPAQIVVLVFKVVGTCEGRKGRNLNEALH